MLTYNLIDQPFIVVLENGTPVPCSLRQVLLNAHRYTEISHPSPLACMALLRLTLAVLQRIFGAEPPSVQLLWWRDGHFPADSINTYLDRWLHRFNLFDTQQPILQLADFTLEQSRRPITALLAEAASGNNKLLFDHSRDETPPALDASAAAIALVAAQCFALGGGRSAFQYTAHAPSATAILFAAQGDNLFQTLLLNLAPQSAAEHKADLASWEREQPLRVEDMRNGCRFFYTGPAQLYSMPSRSIRLHPENIGDEIRVSWVSLASGATYDDQRGTLHDPMISYRYDEKLGRFAMALSSERAFWRDYQALRPFANANTANWQAPTSINHAATLLRLLRLRQPVAAMLCAQANDKAKVEFWRQEQFTLPTSLYHDESAWDLIRSALEVAEHAGTTLSACSYRLACWQLSEDGKAEKKRAGSLTESFPMKPFYWSRLEQAFREWLAQYDENSEDAKREKFWLRHVESALYSAWKLASTAVSRDFRGDQAIVESRPPLDKLLRDLRRRIRGLRNSTGDDE